MDEFDELEDDEHEEALEMVSDIMDMFVGKNIDICFAVLDMCIEALDHTERAWFEEQKRQKSIDMN